MQQRLVGNSVMKTVVAAVILSGTAILKSHAQTNSINAFSPYSMFGIGELSTQGTLPMRSMGGVGIAWRSSSMTSLLPFSRDISTFLKRGEPIAYSSEPGHTG